MNRRQMVLLPGTALLATEAFAQSQSATRTPTSLGSLTTHKALKSATKYGRSKYAYKIPKTPAKQAKYLNFLSALLSLSTTQLQQGANIFATASTSMSPLHAQAQAAHDALSVAIQANDGAAITQASAAIGALSAQRRALGAQANASFYQILTAPQQTTLANFQLKST